MALSRARAILLLAVMVLVAEPAHAEAGDFALALRSLRDQFVSRGVSTEGPEGPCRQEAVEAVLREGIEPYLADPALARLDPASRLAEVVQARGRTLSAFGVMDLAGAWVDSGGDRAKFLHQLRLLAQERKIPMDFSSARVERAVDRVFAKLQELAELNVNLTHSARYEHAGWMVDVRSAWYPLAGRVHLFLVATASCEGGALARSSILNLSGAVWPRAAGGYMARLDETVFEVRCCETRLSGDWSDTLPTAGGASVYVSSTLSMKIVGRSVRGRLVQMVAGDATPGHAIRGKVVYLLEGRMEGPERLEGTFTATGDAEAAGVLTGRVLPSLKGTWGGRLEAGKAEGTLVVEGGGQVPWKARVVDSRESGS